MIMTIYYLYGASKGKDYALSELKSQLLNEREDFKKRIVQAAAVNELSGRKSVSAKKMVQLIIFNWVINLCIFLQNHRLEQTVGDASCVY